MRVRRLFDLLGTRDPRSVAAVLGYTVIPIGRSGPRWAVGASTICASDGQALREAVAWVAAMENGTPELSSEIQERLLDF